MLHVATHNPVSLYEQVFENNLPRPHSDDAPLVIDAIAPGRFYSFNSLRSNVRSVAMTFRDQYDLHVGDTVAIYAPNDIDYFVAVHGSIAAGCQTLILPICATEHELAATFEAAAGPRILITHPSVAEFALAALKRYGKSIPVLTMGGAVTTDIQNSSAKVATAMKPLSDLFCHPDVTTGQLPEVGPENIAYFFTTSGSTGPRKLVTITHQIGIARLKVVANYVLVPTDTSRMIAISHFGHGMAGTFALQAAVMLGASQYVVDSTDIDTIFSAVERHQITDMIISPWLVGFAARHPDKLKEYNLASLRMVTTSGQAIPVKTLQKAKSHLGISTLPSIYGSTEGLLPVCPVGTTEIKEYVGTRYSEEGYDIRLVDGAGKDVLPGQPGELWAKIPTLALGYYKNEAKTAEVFDVDGYYHTGDIFTEDKDGHFHFVGRKSDFIKTCFKTVAAKPIEDVCMSFEGVHECAVIGALSAAHSYEFPRAYIVLSNTSESESFRSAESLLQYVNAHVPEECMRLQGGVQFLSGLPRTSTGKIDRMALRASAQQEMEKEVGNVPW